MKRIKEYVVDTVICAMLTSPIIVPTFITYFVAYRSGFAQAYNETVQRNVQRILDTKYDWIKYSGTHYGIFGIPISPSDKLRKLRSVEELRFKQKLLGEIIELSRGHEMHTGKQIQRDLEEITEYLKNR